MKAIVMAGGEGTRLRPVTAARPKPMVRILDKPVIDYILRLLKKHGITDVCITTGYMSDAVEAYVKSVDFGMNISCRAEREPLGTAGGVKACADFIGEDDCLVISGDAMCDFDLTACFDFHRGKNAEATIVLCSHDSPLEYGLVVTGRGGRIERFVEKPSWDAVCTDCINTGVYILSPELIREIPDGKYDFGKDFFPRLLTEKRRLFGVHADGYWCDVGTPEAYLRCAFDMLDGKMRFDRAVPETGKGVWSASAIPEDAVVVPPVFIGENVSIESGARIGPYAVVGAGSAVGAGAELTNCVMDGARAGARASVCGAVICRGASIGAGADIAEGAVIGDSTIVGDGCRVMQRVKIWPEKGLPDNSTVRESVVTGSPRAGVSFGAQSVISGEFNITLTPEQCFAIGAASAEFGKVGISACGGEAETVTADAMSCGVRSAGAEAVRLDCAFPSCAAFTARSLSLKICIFVRRSGANTELMFFGEDGMCLDRSRQRKIEAAADGEFKRAMGFGVGCKSSVSGTEIAYLSAAASSVKLSPSMPRVRVKGSGEASRALRRALAGAGCTIEERGMALPVFELTDGGFGLTLRDEEGRFYGQERALVLTALAEFEHGSGTVAVPYGAPGALDILASSLGTRVLRIGRDGEEAEALYRSQIFMRDGIFAALKLCAAMGKTGERLADMAARTPEFSVTEHTVTVACGRAKAMRLLVNACSEMAGDIFEGLRIDTGRGIVGIRPGASPKSLIISGEAAREETAEELCADFILRAKKLK